ncbi:MAG: dihydroorotate dehydrogenase [Candidatus Hodarchaeota archaeon]
MLSTNLCGLELANPLILASGILGVSGSMLRRLAEKHHIGAVTSKSIGPEPRQGNLNPSIIEIEKDIYLNAVGLANPGVDEFILEIPEAKVPGVPIIMSIFGETEDQYPEIAKKVENSGIDAIELNISCPHATVSSIGADKDLTYKVVKSVKDAVKLPVFAKLNPNVTNIVEIGLSAEKAGADAVVAINTMRGMVIDVDIKKPILFNKSGGVSGKAIKPMAIKAVYDLYENLKIPIIASGGIFSGLDVIEFFLAGASAVQIGTAFIRGFEIIDEIKNEMIQYLEKNSIKNISELIGEAH